MFIHNGFFFFLSIKLRFDQNVTTYKLIYEYQKNKTGLIVPLYVFILFIFSEL